MNLNELWQMGVPRLIRIYYCIVEIFLCSEKNKSTIIHENLVTFPVIFPVGFFKSSISFTTTAVPIVEAVVLFE